MNDVSAIIGKRKKTMGLDQYAYVVDPKNPEADSREIACWRKHPNLQGWMESLYFKKGGKEEQFNCVAVKINAEDLDALDLTINNKELPETQGFFFGSDSDDYYKDQDIQFIEDARVALDKGMIVEYSSWW
jgi:hypothetical protein